MPIASASSHSLTRTRKKVPFLRAVHGHGDIGTTATAAAAGVRRKPSVPSEAGARARERRCHVRGKSRDQ